MLFRSGIYCVKTQDLFSALHQVSNVNDQHEYYLTDIIEILKNEGKKVGAFVINNELEVHGINDLDDLKLAEENLTTNY